MVRAKKVMVTLFKGGTEEKTLPIDEVHIPHLWHVAQAVRRGKYIKPASRKKACEMILETWHIAAWLRRHIQENEGKAEGGLKIKLVFLDWKERGKSIYSSNVGVALSSGVFHGGSTFDGTITFLDLEDERELRRALLEGFQPCFWISAYGDEIKLKAKGKRK